MEGKSTGKRWTYSEFARLPPSGSTRYRIIDDELVVTPAPTPGHQRVVARLLYLLVGFAQRHDLEEAFPAPLDVLFAEGDYFEPDVLFVRKDRLDLLSDRGMEGPPDLVIEIVSPSTCRSTGWWTRRRGSSRSGSSRRLRADRTCSARRTR